MEYLDLYDENRNFTGNTILRGSGKPEPGNFINLVIIFIKNDENKFLIQKTSKEKKGIWATTGGHVKSGQTFKEAIIEEVKEELGIDISRENFKLVYTEKFEFAFMDVYYLEKNIDIKDMKIQEEEVEFVKWLSIDEIRKLIENGEFRRGNINAFEYIIKKCIKQTYL